MKLKRKSELTAFETLSFSRIFHILFSNRKFDFKSSVLSSRIRLLISIEKQFDWVVSVDFHRWLQIKAQRTLDLLSHMSSIASEKIVKAEKVEENVDLPVTSLKPFCT